jgi:peptidylprolyl isomerase
MKRSLLLLTIVVASFMQIQAQTEVTFYTNYGIIKADLYDWTMPITTGNFKSLINAKFYDGLLFHRVINGFMIQGGDPNGNGSGGPGYTIPDEFAAVNNNAQQTIAMANAGPNTGGSQFFINLVNNTFLNPNYPVFGIVTTNFAAVQTIGAVATNASDKPLSDVRMDSVRITGSSPAAINEQPNHFTTINVYPNPVNENSILTIQLNENIHAQLTLLNQDGKVIYNQEVEFVKGENTISLQHMYFNALPSGNYYIGLSDGKSFVHKKITIVH